MQKLSPSVRSQLQGDRPSDANAQQKTAQVHEMRKMDLVPEAEQALTSILAGSA